ncbi:sulfurtransferase [Corynebacterium bouchesdurhonense]|uniref:sulfurtransferase n=1 Tax=Corynebacterium bouchesdurhonense TaxID=1720192 RepID=UPI000835E1E6|nr:sulfurtransferase [Corynebacterium bouchesdurhonense]
MSVFVSAETLHEHIKSGKRQTVLASLWEAKSGQSWSKFQSEHIPTAVFCDPASQLTGMPGRRGGRNPLPDVETLRRAVRAWGVEPGRPVFIYDGGNGLFAARAWWVLRWAGIEDVSILDGGFAEWDARGLPTVAGPGNVVVPRQVEISTGHLPTAEMEEVREFEGLLVDARSQRRFQGRREILDLQAGHIPGAVNLPVGDLFEEDSNAVKPAEEIRERLAEVGITQDSDPADAIFYSGSGNHSALLLAAMAHAGLPVPRHYIGGWSQWSANPGNPVSTDL